ncbi:MAG: hypothetical protein Q9212_003924 [Teloschistes hypoglaucus]
MSSYQYSTQDDIQTAAAPRKLSQYCDFITFLEIAQNLSIDFLPITWQQALGNIGKGATAEICEALLDVNTSFAFKRRLFEELIELEELTGKILPSVVAEISILLTPSIRHCPHIMNIVGICWDIYSGEDDTFSREKPLEFSSAAVVPVLVFDKSRHGDLHTFMTAGVGKDLGYVERLQICIEIATAISLVYLIYQLYRADYRVRIYIANCLINAVSASQKDVDGNPPSADLCIQSALCYEVGFGVARNQRKSYEVLQGRMAYELQLAGHLRCIRGEQFNLNSSSGIFNWTESKGTVQFIDVNAESLALTYTKQERWDRSDELLEAIIYRRSNTHGYEHPKTLQSQVCSVESYMDRGASERGKQLGTQVLEILRRTQGLQHPDTLRCVAVIANFLLGVLLDGRLYSPIDPRPLHP